MKNRPAPGQLPEPGQGYGEGVCTECATVSELVLPARFPHVCRTCLFPPRKRPDANNNIPAYTPAMTLYDRLDSFKSNGLFRGGEYTAGDLPEKHRKWRYRGDG